MPQREKKSSIELEALCLNVLRRRNGLEGLKKVWVGAYRGKLGFTWEITLYDGDVGPQAIIDALPEVRKLQQAYDLK